MKLPRVLEQAVRRLRNRKSDRRALLLDRLPQGGKCAEVGVWKGDFSEMILERVEPDQLYLIDPWEYQPEFTGMWYGGGRVEGQNDMDAIYERVRSELGEQSSVRIIREYSSNAASQIEEGTLDWVYIDGNHTYDYVKADLEQYYPTVWKGGYIIGDDYEWGEGRGYPVKKAVR